MNLSYLPTSGLKCPYCRNKERKPRYYFKMFEKDAMTGSIKSHAGYFIYTESWLCLKCERLFKVRLSIKSKAVSFSQVKR